MRESATPPPPGQRSVAKWRSVSNEIPCIIQIGDARRSGNYSLPGVDSHSFSPFECCSRGTADQYAVRVLLLAILMWSIGGAFRGVFRGAFRGAVNTPHPDTAKSQFSGSIPGWGSSRIVYIQSYIDMFRRRSSAIFARLRRAVVGPFCLPPCTLPLSSSAIYLLFLYGVCRRCCGPGCAGLCAFHSFLALPNRWARGEISEIAAFASCGLVVSRASVETVPRNSPGNPQKSDWWPRHTYATIRVAVRDSGFDFREMK